MEISSEVVAASIGYTFHDPALLTRALTHPSLSRRDNQRLEFLGDAVLEYIISDILYHRYPDEQEGSLTKKRQLLVDEVALAEIARKLHIGEALRMDHGEELTGGRENPSVLCDAMEAVLAAVYLDGGIDPVRRIVEANWPRPEDVHRPMLNSKGALQEFLQKDGSEAPVYTIIAQDGPPHARVFTASVAHMGSELAQGTGKTKQQAEQAAALAALKKLGGES